MTIYLMINLIERDAMHIVIKYLIQPGTTTDSTSLEVVKAFRHKHEEHIKETGNADTTSYEIG